MGAVMLPADKQHFLNFLPLPQVQGSFLEFDNSYSLGWQLETKSSGADVSAEMAALFRRRYRDGFKQQMPSFAGIV